MANMRRAQQQLNRGLTGGGRTRPSPPGGGNARESLANMGKKDAVSMDNFFCRPYDVMLRYGYSQWATGITGSVNTLASYSPLTGGADQFAFAEDAVYDTTVSGVVGTPVIQGNISD